MKNYYLSIIDQLQLLLVVNQKTPQIKKKCGKKMKQKNGKKSGGKKNHQKS